MTRAITGEVLLSLVRAIVSHRPERIASPVDFQTAPLLLEQKKEYCFETRANRLGSCRKHPTAVTQPGSEHPSEVTDAFFFS
jgi:hypothetical protein